MSNPIADNIEYFIETKKTQQYHHWLRRESLQALLFISSHADPRDESRWQSFVRRMSLQQGDTPQHEQEDQDNLPSIEEVVVANSNRLNENATSYFDRPFESDTSSLAEQEIAPWATAAAEEQATPISDRDQGKFLYMNASSKY